MNRTPHILRVAGIVAALATAALAAGPATQSGTTFTQSGSTLTLYPPTTAPAPATQPAAPAPVVPRLVARNNFVVVNAVAGGRGGINANAFAQQRKMQIQSSKNYVNNLPDSGKYKVDDLIHLSIKDGILDLDTTGTIGLHGQNRVKIEGLHDPGAETAGWTINSQDMRMRGRGGLIRQRFLALCRYDWDQTDDGQFWCTQLNCNDSYLMLNAQGVTSYVNYNQFRGQNQVNLQIRELGPNANRMGVMLHASSLLQLQTEHPDEVRKYLAPMLLKLTGKDLLRPGATDVYGVFTEIAPDPQVQQAVLALLPGLDDIAFKQREQASRDLAKLGIPGILAVLRIDQNILTEEQKARFESFTSTERRRTIDNPEAARKDPSFLLEAVDDDDLAVRVAAKSALESVLGHPVAFDPSQDAKVRQAAVDALRQSVRKELAARTPATQPAAPAAAIAPGVAGPSTAH